jgi:DNA-3-methyladenine glycosylase II
MTLSLEPVHRFTLRIPPPFDFAMTVAKPAGWHWTTPREIFRNGTLWTGIRIKGVPFGLRMSARKNIVTVSVFGGPAQLSIPMERIEREVASGLGADEDLPGFYDFARTDPVLSAAVDHLTGMHIGSFDDLFGDVILAILLQMAPMSRSSRMMNAVLDNYGTPLEFDGEEVPLWPRADEIASLDPAELRTTAKIGYRAERLVAAANYLTLHPLSGKALSAIPEEDAVRELTKIPGIGPYSAGIILGTLPVDVWSVVILSELFLGRTPKNPREEIDSVVSHLTQRWGKWRWYAFVYVLNDLPFLAETYHLSRVT